ncbi:MAG TPA: DUF4893 domain-containing protein [Allosphingosinicella sp.]|nr:DUF4893 domain-containing protein [Allosphingosinicella sp.]
MPRLSYRLSILALAALASTAGAFAREEVVPVRAGSDWRQVATEEDRDRVRHWRDAWVEALAQANVGHAAAIAAGGALFEPDTALAGAQPPAGDYACRTVKLGHPRRATSGLDYVDYPVFRCRIAMVDGRLSFTKLTGSQRPVGTIFPDNGRRMIFLGTLMLGDETRALRYSRDRERDLIGIIERVGERRWRLVFPRPHYESLLDVIELTPSP